MSSRRRVLQLVGGGTVLAAVGVGGFALANGPSSSARAPWRRAGDYTDPRLHALSYAILAPNPHNLQPWRVELDGDDALTVTRDPAKALPETDPFDRQITIGFGAFLELLRMAAAKRGFRAETVEFPDGTNPDRLDGRPVARVRLIEDDADADPLFAHVLDRRTNRGVYHDRPVAASALSALREAGSVGGTQALTTDRAEDLAMLRDLTWRAHEVEATTPATHMESVDVMRIGRAEVARDPDGIVLEGPVIAAARLTGALDRGSLADPDSDVFRQGMDMYRDRAASAQAFLWLRNAGRTRGDQLEAGCAWVRAHLAATAHGLAVHPWSQALQEYPEMSGLFDEAHERLGSDGGAGARVQMLARVGHARPVGPSPRWPLEAVVKGGV